MSCKNGLADRDAIWEADSSGSKEPCIRWGPDPHEKGHFRVGLVPAIVKYRTIQHGDAVFAKLLWTLALFSHAWSRYTEVTTIFGFNTSYVQQPGCFCGGVSTGEGMGGGMATRIWVCPISRLPSLFIPQAYSVPYTSEV